MPYPINSTEALAGSFVWKDDVVGGELIANIASAGSGSLTPEQQALINDLQTANTNLELSFTALSNSVQQQVSAAAVTSGNAVSIASSNTSKIVATQKARHPFHHIFVSPVTGDSYGFTIYPDVDIATVLDLDADGLVQYHADNAPERAGEIKCLVHPFDVGSQTSWSFGMALEIPPFEALCSHHYSTDEGYQQKVRVENVVYMAATNATPEQLNVKPTGFVINETHQGWILTESIPP